MSKYMRMTDDYRTELKSKYIAEFSGVVSKYLEGNEPPDGKLSFIRNLPGTNRKAIVYFTSIAWSKMIAVINEFDKEVAWHGLVRKLEPEDDKQAYLVYDIGVYPQEVTGATVTTDQKEYESWMDLFSDDDFKAVRAQGHSHVNMGVSPSTVDIGHRERIVWQLSDDMFYIFMIWNKRFQHHITIYDLGDNVTYEDGDVEVKLYDSDGGLDEFISNAKTLVKTKTYSTSTTSNKNEGKTKSLPEHKEKDKRKEVSTSKPKEKQRVSYSSFRPDSQSYDEEDYDDFRDPYSAFGYSYGRYSDYNSMYGY